MGLGRGDVLGIKVTIDVDGDVDFLHDRIGTLGEPAAPHLVAHDLLLMTCRLIVALCEPQLRRCRREPAVI